MNTHIKEITLRHIEMPLVQPFTTSFGTQTNKDCILVEMVNKEGLTGWSEIPVTIDPGYAYETVKTAWHILEDFLIPYLQKSQNNTELVILIPNDLGQINDSYNHSLNMK